VHEVRLVEAPDLSAARADLSPLTALHVHSVLPNQPGDVAGAVANEDYLQVRGCAWVCAADLYGRSVPPFSLLLSSVLLKVEHSTDQIKHNTTSRHNKTSNQNQNHKTKGAAHVPRRRDRRRAALGRRV
jgi:hypothetical protein